MCVRVCAYVTVRASTYHRIPHACTCPHMQVSAELAGLRMFPDGQDGSGRYRGITTWRVRWGRTAAQAASPPSAACACVCLPIGLPDDACMCEPACANICARGMSARTVAPWRRPAASLPGPCAQALTICNKLALQRRIARLAIRGRFGPQYPVEVGADGADGAGQDI